jgi:hypothetical protein
MNETKAEKSTMVRVPADILAMIDEIAKERASGDSVRRQITRADVVRYVVREYHDRVYKGANHE